MSKRLFQFLLFFKVLVLLLVLPLASLAEEPPMQWDNLSPQQQKILKRFESQWPTYSEDRKQRLLTGVDRWMNASPEQRDMMKQRYAAWEGLPDDKKQLLRRKFQEFKSLSPEEQAEAYDVVHEICI